MSKITLSRQVRSHTVMVSQEAVVHRACRVCGAPGVFKSRAEPRFRSWPGVVVDPDDERIDQPVGASCPNCDHPRPPAEDLGVIAYYHRNPLKRWRFAIAQWFKKWRP